MLNKRYSKIFYEKFLHRISMENNKSFLFVDYIQYIRYFEFAINFRIKKIPFKHPIITFI